MNTYTTSEIAKIVGVTSRTIHYWANFGHEDEDEDMRRERKIQRDPQKRRNSKMKPVKGFRRPLLPKVTRQESFGGRTKGQRVFTDDDLARFHLVKLLQDGNLPLERIAEILSDPSQVDLKQILDESLDDLQEKRAELEDKERRLRSLGQKNSLFHDITWAPEPPEAPTDAENDDQDRPLDPRVDAG
ncbi:MAG: MerR family transcriptional regulator [Propionibacteriaceae bacterium]|jgi:DNA-binding transcriptional MerR regulator|nr:MerR family transcriptional regulator [Propionibacteriaceae bacterium]